MVFPLHAQVQKIVKCRMPDQPGDRQPFVIQAGRPIDAFRGQAQRFQGFPRCGHVVGQSFAQHATHAAEDQAASQGVRFEESLPPVPARKGRPIALDRLGEKVRRRPVVLRAQGVGEPHGECLRGAQAPGARQ